jgi:hypothetical protein
MRLRAQLAASLVLGCACVAALAAAQPGGPVLPESALAVSQGDAWRTWWRSAEAPRRWADSIAELTGAVRWRAAAPGVEVGELRLAGSGEAWRVRVVAVRIDPRRAALRLHTNDAAGGAAAPWSVDAAPAQAAVALNAGQFTSAGPWGWVVRDGTELRAPGSGPLAPAVVVDDAGRVRIVAADSIAAVRAAGGVREAFQSYPALLLGDGDVPAPLQASGRGVDLAHRDARLALGELRDGRVLVALTRFEALGGALDALPFGPTVPEMAAVMGALGARRALLLDGGISGQLLVRERGRTRAWTGLRKVPLGVVVVPR